MDAENKKKEESPSRVLFTSKDIKIFSDAEAASAAERDFILNQSPIERIRETVQLILRVYPIKEKKDGPDKIYFDHP
jgi:hypothetical protein